MQTCAAHFLTKEVNKDDFKIRVNLDKTGKVFNSKDYLKYAEELKRTVRSRMPV